MDSIKGCHRGLKNLIQSYLWEEWKTRQNQPAEDVSSKFLNLQCVPLELPQQENSSDCGLFLLHYVELFLDGVPVDFSPFKITKFSNFLTKDWFPPADVSHKRAHIKKLIYEIVEDTSRKANTAPYADDQYPSSRSPGIDKRNTGTPLKDSQYSKYPESLHGEFLEARAAGGLLRARSNQSFGQMVSLAMSPIQEGDEPLEEIAHSPTVGGGGRQRTEVALASAPAYSTKEFRMLEASSNPVASIHLEEHENEDLLSTSTSRSPISTEAGVNEDNWPQEILGPNPSEGKGKCESPSALSDGLVVCVMDSEEEDGTPTLAGCVAMDSEEEDGDKTLTLTACVIEDSEEEGEMPLSSDKLAHCVVEDSKEEYQPETLSDDDLAACIVEDSEEEDGTLDVIEIEYSPFRLGKILGAQNQEVSSTENIVQAKYISLGSESEEHKAAKR